MKHPNILLCLLVLTACASAPEDAEPTPDTPPAVDPPVVDEPPPESLRAAALRVHLQALEAAAYEHEGHRAVGSEGYEASVVYVESVLTELGLTPWREPVDVFDYELSSYALEVGDADVRMGQDVVSMGWSASGDVTATVHAVDLMLPPSDVPNSSTSGCEADDFEDFPASSIALIQRGGCTFTEKASNAEDAGAVAVLVFNEGQPYRQDAFEGSLDTNDPPGIPVLALSYDLGLTLKDYDEPVRVVVDAELTRIPTDNVLVDLPGDTGRHWVVGGHLDSVPAGPGLNDNGTGVAAMLQLAAYFVDQPSEGRHGIRLGFWAAEEIGLVGSSQHAARLSQDEVDDIVGNLTFDMIGSPNPVRFVYDGDRSDFEPARTVDLPDSSAVIEAAFEKHFDGLGLYYAPTAFQGRTDYVGFANRGIPVGGTFTGASTPMDATLAAATDGTAGEPFDACYHRSCDTVDNVDLVMLEQMTQAAAAVLVELRESDALGQRRAPRLPGAPALVHVGGCRDGHAVALK